MSAADSRVVAKDLAALALDVAREAALLVRDRASREVTVADTKSSEVDVVTEADRASERLIRRLLRERRPDDAFLGEEGSDEEGTSGVRWIIDPIDGTVNFLYGLPQYAVSIAAEQDGEVVAGVVLNAATGTEYVAHVDGDGTPSRDPGRPVAARRTRPGAAGRAPGRHRLQLRRLAARDPGAGDWSGCCRGSATSGGSARPPWTCATSPRAPSTPTWRRA